MTGSVTIFYHSTSLYCLFRSVIVLVDSICIHMIEHSRRAAQGSISQQQSAAVDHKVIQIKQIDIVGFETDRDTKRPTVSLLLSFIYHQFPQSLPCPPTHPRVSYMNQLIINNQQ